MDKDNAGSNRYITYLLAILLLVAVGYFGLNYMKERTRKEALLVQQEALRKAAEIEEARVKALQARIDNQAEQAERSAKLAEEREANRKLDAAASQVTESAARVELQRERFDEQKKQVEWHKQQQGSRDARSTASGMMRGL